MSHEQNSIRFGWIRGMYFYTLFGAGSFGIGIILFPDAIAKLFGIPNTNPFFWGVTAGLYTAFAFCSYLGLKAPLKFVPILLLQLAYKTIWMIGVILPSIITGEFKAYIILPVILYGTYICGDLKAIPFSYLLGRQKIEPEFAYKGQEDSIQWGWIKGMYLYTLFGAGGAGLASIFFPEAVTALFGVPKYNPFIFGITVSAYTAFAFCSYLGLKSPLKFTPILMLQLTYKTIWMVFVVVPLIIAGKFQAYALTFVILYATWIYGDLKSIPFSYIFGNQDVQPGYSEKNVSEIQYSFKRKMPGTTTP